MKTGAYTIESWQELLNFVCNNEHSDFYQKKFAEADFDPSSFQSLEDITSIPLLNKAELAAVPAENICFVPESEIQTISPTSGTTTSTPLITFISPTPLSPRSAEVNDFGRTLILFNPTRSGVLMSYYLLRKEIAFIGDMHNLPASAVLASKARVKTLMTTPTLAQIFKKYLDVYPAILNNLKYLRVGGELMTPAKKKMLRTLYPDLDIFTLYASSEVGRAASQCLHLSRNDQESQYHIDNNGYFFEIIDKETGARVEEGMTGELVITDFTNRATPLVRYRTGDIAKLSPSTNCSCGRTGQLLTVFGRTASDSVRAGGFEIHKNMFEGAFVNLRDIITHNFEIHVQESFVYDKPLIGLTCKIELQPGVNDAPSITEKILNELKERVRISPNLNLNEATQSGLFSPIKVEFTQFPKAAKAVEKIILN